MTSPSFAQLGLDPALLETLTQLGYREPTPIQAAALPSALGGRDLVAQASTGSGKTAVFALALLGRLNLKFFGVQALVLCPTRELADQVATEVRKLGRSRENLKVVTLCGGVPLRGQAESLAHGAHVVVGTPGRVQDHLGRRTLTLEGLRTLVFDEADRMLDMGFVEDMRAVVRACPRVRQTLLFSATYPASIAQVAGPFLTDPLTIETPSASVPLIEQRLYEVSEETRPVVLAALLAHFRPERCLVFTNTKAAAREAAAFLRQQGVAALELSGDLEQRERDEVMTLFSARCLSVLVATDVASRGLDIPALDAVINYEVTPDPEVHIHRIGRTGRAGVPGRALTLVGPGERSLAGRLKEAVWAPVASLEPHPQGLPRPPHAMVRLWDGKKEKLRPGDVLGALTADAGFRREQIGTIKVTEWGTWVAVESQVVDEVLAALTRVPVKGKVRKASRVR